MQMPLDIKEVLQAAADTDAARNMPISISVFLDPQSSRELQDCVIRSFTTKAPAALVAVSDYPDGMFALNGRDDLAVLVAGTGEETGKLADTIRKNGVPVMVVTVMPETIKALAQESGYPLLEEDVISPLPAVDGGSLPSDHELNCEPYPLTIDRVSNLSNRMGEWVVATFREKRLAFALAFPFVRRPLSADFTNATAIQNAGIGLVMIIPGADLPVMTLNQAKMVLQIAAAYDQELGSERALELLSVVGGGFACRSIARQLVSVLPGFGWAVKAGVGFSGTIVMGYATIAYFEALQSAGMKPIDAVGIMREEAQKIQVAIKGVENPVDAAVAAAKVVANDLARIAFEKAKVLAPAVLSAAVSACKTTNIHPVDLGKRVLLSVVDSKTQ